MEKSNEFPYEKKGEKYCDCKFLLGPKKKVFNCHKTVLAAGSPIFHRMLYGSLKENCKKPIPIPDINADAFGIFLQFLYSDKYSDFPEMHHKVHPTQSRSCGCGKYHKMRELLFINFGELLYIADKYDVPEFEQFCFRSIEIEFYYVPEESICPIYDAVFSNKNATKLKILCEEKIYQRFRDNSIYTGISNLQPEAFYEIINYLKNKKDPNNYNKTDSVLLIFEMIDDYATKNNLLDYVNSNWKPENASEQEAQTITQLRKLFENNLRESKPPYFRSLSKIFVLSLYEGARLFKADNMIDYCEKAIKNYPIYYLQSERALKMQMDTFDKFLSLLNEQYYRSVGQVNDYLYTFFQTIDKFAKANHLLRSNGGTSKLQSNQSDEIEETVKNNNSKQSLEKLFHKFLYDKRMTREDFKSGPATSELLRDEDADTILSRFWENEV